MTKLIQEIQAVGRIVDLRDPDYLPGAIEREAEARARSAGHHFNATEALKGEVAKALKAKVRTWKNSGTASENREWAELTLPTFKTDGGKQLMVTIGHDPFYRGYGMSITPTYKRAEGPFIDSKKVSAELDAAILAAWENATGQKLLGMDVNVPVDSGRDHYYNSIRVVRIAPSVKLPAKKMIAGVKAIIKAIKEKL